MHKRIVFPIYEVEAAGADLSPVLVSHFGRSTTEDQESESGKWWHYPGYYKGLYNIQNALLDSRSIAQAKETGRVVVVESATSVARFIQAGLYNVVSSFGSNLNMDDHQLSHFKLIFDHLKIDHFLIWFDNDNAGINKQPEIVSRLMETGIKAVGFDWAISFQSDSRRVALPDSHKKPHHFNSAQLRFLRKEGVI